MPNKIFNIRLRNKRDTEANWEKKNPLILDGEIIVVTTTSGETRVKIGDGVKTYTQLPFWMMLALIYQSLHLQLLV